jgi:hypothetical protein
MRDWEAMAPQPSSSAATQASYAVRTILPPWDVDWLGSMSSSAIDETTRQSAETPRSLAWSLSPERTLLATERSDTRIVINDSTSIASVYRRMVDADDADESVGRCHVYAGDVGIAYGSARNTVVAMILGLQSGYEGYHPSISDLWSMVQHFSRFEAASTVTLYEYSGERSMRTTVGTLPYRRATELGLRPFVHVDRLEFSYKACTPRSMGGVVHLTYSNPPGQFEGREITLDIPAGLFGRAAICFPYTILNAANMCQ